MPAAERFRLRTFYSRVRERMDTGAELEPLERLVADVLTAHPEYAVVVSDPRALAEDFGGPNPYLHMGMHVARLEQVQSDRPPGIRRLYRRITRRHPDRRAAEHAMKACLQGALLEAGHRGIGLDAMSDDRYLAALRAVARGGRA